MNYSNFIDGFHGSSFLLIAGLIFCCFGYYTYAFTNRRENPNSGKNVREAESANPGPTLKLQPTPPLFTSDLIELLDSGIESSIGRCFRVKVEIALNKFREEHIMLSAQNSVLVIANWYVESVHQAQYKNYLQRFNHAFTPTTVEETSERFHECCTDLASHLVMIKKGLKP